MEKRVELVHDVCKTLVQKCEVRHRTSKGRVNQVHYYCPNCRTDVPLLHLEKRTFTWQKELTRDRI